MKHIEELLSGNTLIESLENAKEEEGLENENMLVIAFYLLTRESGLLFQKISNILNISEKFNFTLITETDLQDVVLIFFNSLLNIKHLGSIDRIANG